MTDILDLPQIVESAFNRALATPDIRRWHSVAVMAGCAAVRMAAEGRIYQAAAMEGVAEEANRQKFAMMPRGMAA